MRVLTCMLVALVAAFGQTGTTFGGSRTMAAGNTLDLTQAKAKVVRVMGSDSSGSCPDNNAWELNPTTRRLFACLGGTWYKMADGLGVTLSGTENLTNKTLTLPVMGSYTVAGLPAPGLPNRLAIVTDASTPGSCTSGGGSARSLCRDTGSAWEGVGDGGSGGGGLQDINFTPTKTAASVLTIGVACSVSTPCKHVIGEKPITLTAPATVTLSGGSASANIRVWIDEVGVKVGSSSATPTVTCNSNCSVIAGAVSAYPDQTAHIGVFTYTSNIFDAITGAMDERRLSSSQRVDGGSSGNVVVATNPTTGAREVDLADSINLSSRTETVPNKGGTFAGRPSTCSQGATYLQTDATVGLYVHAGAAGACSFSQVGGTPTYSMQIDFSKCAYFANGYNSLMAAPSQAATGTPSKYRSMYSAFDMRESGAYDPSGYSCEFLAPVSMGATITLKFSYHVSAGDTGNAYISANTAYLPLNAAYTAAPTENTPVTGAYQIQTSSTTNGVNTITIPGIPSSNLAGKTSWIYFTRTSQHASDSATANQFPKSFILEWQ